MTAAASMNAPSFRNATYDPYNYVQSSTLDSYSRATMESSRLTTATSQHTTSHPSVQATNYTSNHYAANANYTGSNAYYRQTSQPQAHDAYPTQQPYIADPFYANAEPYEDSCTIPGYPTEAEDPTDQYHERSPQLQIWAEETSDVNLPVNERLVRSNWE